MTSIWARAFYTVHEWGLLRPRIFRGFRISALCCLWWAKIWTNERTNERAPPPILAYDSSDITQMLSIPIYHSIFYIAWIFMFVYSVRFPSTLFYYYSTLFCSALPHQCPLSFESRWQGPLQQLALWPTQQHVLFNACGTAPRTWLHVHCSYIQLTNDEHANSSQSLFLATGNPNE